MTEYSDWDRMNIIGSVFICRFFLLFRLSVLIGSDFWLDSIYILDKTAYVFSRAHIVSILLCLFVL